MTEFGQLGYGGAAQHAFEQAAAELALQGKSCVPGRVTSLDRGYPLVCTPDGEVRAELATAIKKSDDSIVAIGDWVALYQPATHEKDVIECILPRQNEIARVKRIGRERQPRRQVLASNVDVVLICQSLTGDGVDERLLVRQVVAAAGCDARPVIILTKGDMVSGEAAAGVARRIERLMPGVPVHVVSVKDEGSVGCVAREIGPSSTALLLGESGVGKSSLVNVLLGADVAQTGSVRSSDDKGRHTTVARRMVPLPQGGIIIDAPGLRTLQILDMPKSLRQAFPDIVEAAAGCRFRDCTHSDEPGCTVRGVIDPERLKAYGALLSSSH